MMKFKIATPTARNDDPWNEIISQHIDYVKKGIDKFKL